jgi:hypothetical protein
MAYDPQQAPVLLWIQGHRFRPTQPATSLTPTRATLPSSGRSGSRQPIEYKKLRIACAQEGQISCQEGLFPSNPFRTSDNPI